MNALASRDESPAVLEWEDGGSLSAAVEGLAAERRGLAQLDCWRRAVAVASTLALPAILWVSAFACSLGGEPFLTCLILAGLVAMGRVCLLAEIDAEADRRRARASALTLDIQRRLARSDWLLDASRA